MMKTTFKFFSMKVALFKLISILLLLILGSGFVVDSIKGDSHTVEVAATDCHESEHSECPDTDCAGICHFGFCQSHLLSFVDLVIARPTGALFQMSHFTVPPGPILESLRRPPRA